MNCIEAEKRLSELIDGEIVGDTLEEFTGHIAGCFSCKSSLDELSAASDLTKKSLFVSTSDSFDRSVLEAIRNADSVSTDPIAPASESVWFSMPRLRLATAMLLLFTLSSIFAFYLGKASVTQTLVSEPRSGDRQSATVNPPKIASSVIDQKSDKEKIRIVEVPVTREKIVMRTVYLKAKRKRRTVLQRRGIRQKKPVEKPIPSEFQLAKEINLRIIVKGESDEE